MPRKPPDSPIAPRGYRWVAVGEPLLATDWCRDFDGKPFQLGHPHLKGAILPYFYLRCKPYRKRTAPSNKPSPS